MSNVRMPFGKHRGQYLHEVPTSYLEWCLSNLQDLDSQLRAAMQEALDGQAAEQGERSESTSGRWRQQSEARQRYQRREQEPPPEPGRQLVELKAIIRMWHREMAMKFHPDRGGSVEAMAAINAAHDRLKKLTGVT